MAAAVANGDKELAEKIYCDATGHGLSTASRFVDQLTEQLRIKYPDRFETEKAKLPIETPRSTLAAGLQSRRRQWMLGGALAIISVTTIVICLYLSGSHSLPVTASTNEMTSSTSSADSSRLIQPTNAETTAVAEKQTGSHLSDVDLIEVDLDWTELPKGFRGNNIVKIYDALSEHNGLYGKIPFDKFASSAERKARTEEYEEYLANLSANFRIGDLNLSSFVGFRLLGREGRDYHYSPDDQKYKVRITKPPVVKLDETTVRSYQLENTDGRREEGIKLADRYWYLDLNGREIHTTFSMLREQARALDKHLDLILIGKITSRFLIESIERRDPRDPILSVANDVIVRRGLHFDGYQLWLVNIETGAIYGKGNLELSDESEFFE